eukprot:TRINITY_DN13575_c0_g1_i7.p1 TRINITY_DN13575_c0_g1~~TRINITY_DN13575_c0_g1_i7.p1  ORF type:complete len:138 (+),score=12.60 TRINITY_DN13575_c0_g1_i7:220-633(+)
MDPDVLSEIEALVRECEAEGVLSPGCHRTHRQAVCITAPERLLEIETLVRRWETDPGTPSTGTPCTPGSAPLGSPMLTQEPLESFNQLVQQLASSVSSRHHLVAKSRPGSRESNHSMRCSPRQMCTPPPQSPLTPVL